MAIQMRRGQYANFDPSRMVAGEYAVVLSGDPDGTYGRGVYMAFAPGTVERVITESDMSVYAADLVDQTAAAEAAATAANAAAAVAGPAATAANSAATSANTAATAANNAAASAIAASGNRLTATLTGPTPQTASDAWTGPLIGATVDGLSTQDGTPTPSAPVAIKSVEGAAGVLRGANVLGLPYISKNAGYTNTASGITYTVMADGGITFSGTATEGINIDLVSQASSETLIRGFTYTLSNIPSPLRAKCWKYGGSGNQFANGQITQTVPEYGNYNFGINIQAGTSITTPITVYPMLTVGNVAAAAYEPYTAASTASLLPSTAAPLRSLPDGTHDELSVARDGTVSVIRRVGTVTYGDGTATSSVWSVDSSKNGRVVLLTPGARTVTSQAEPSACVMSTLVPPKTYAETNTGQVGCSIWPNITNMAQTRVAVVTGDTSITSKGEAVTWLASNPITIIYPLATHTTETLPSVTMPTVPSRNLTAWVDATDADSAAMAAPWEMTYERDVTYVIEQLEQAIADI